MVLARKIAVFLALAIATIAVSLTPSSAQAHDGRAQGDVSMGAHVAHAAQSHVRGGTAVTVQAEARIECAGPCCTASGHHGSCCCATGLAAEDVSAAVPPLASARSLSSEYASPDGLVPEAIPEPPRLFA